MIGVKRPMMSHEIQPDNHEELAKAFLPLVVNVRLSRFHKHVRIDIDCLVKEPDPQRWWMVQLTPNYTAEQLKEAVQILKEKFV